MRKTAVTFVLLLLPAMALAAPVVAPQELELSAKAQVDGATVPLGVVVSTENTDVVLSSTKKDGSTPVTFTLYVSPKPKPVATSSQSAAAVESSAKIQEGIAGFSPAAANVTAPFFTLVDGGRGALSDVIDTQIAATKKNIGPSAGEVLSAEEVKNASSNPMGTFWFILQTLYLYLLTLLNFIIGNAGVFYPALALLILYLLWRIIRRARRPAY